MAGSRGKAFERELRKSFDQTPDALAYRIQDSVFIKNGRMVGSETPGDLWVFCKAGGLTAHLVEAKATSRKSFAFSMLSEGQVSSLRLFDVFSEGAMSWVAVNFYDEYSLRARNVCVMLPFKAVARAIDYEAGRQIRLLEDISSVEGVRRVFIASGIRHDMVLADGRRGGNYLDRVVSKHVSGQMKVAPEHVCDDVLRLMGKPGRDALLGFKGMFDRCCRERGKEEFLTYYLMAAHPGCTRDHMRELASFCSRELGTHPEQVQVFTPTPSTYSTAMWWCGTDEGGRPVTVERSIQGRQRQKEMVCGRRRWTPTSPAWSPNAADARWTRRSSEGRSSASHGERTTAFPSSRYPTISGTLRTRS